VPSEKPFDRAGQGAHGVPLPQEAPWPRQSPLALDNAATALPVPALSIFEIQENPRATAQSLLPHSQHAEQIISTDRETDGIAKAGDGGAARRSMHGKRHSGAVRRLGVAHPRGRGSRIAAHVRHGTLMVQIKKRNV
jgi:hypothetical protein